MAQYAVEAAASWLGTSLSVIASGTWQVAKYTHKWITSEENAEEDVMEESPLLQMVDREKEFHNYVRQQIICMSLFILLYMSAFFVVSRFKRKTEREDLYAGEEDYFVYRVSVWISSTALGTSLGSLTLLPFSVIGVELLQLYDGNYYLQWLNYPLIGALWHYVFMLSNLSLFVLLPFSYFFIESQGFSSHKIGGNATTQRIYEAMAISFLFAFVLLCLAEVVLTILDYPVSFLSITSVNLPLIYSCVSFMGAVLLLISTPYGFARMFSFARDFFCEENAEEKEVEPSAESPGSVEPAESLETVRNAPFDDVILSPDDVDLRKDSDSGIESGSVEEMRLDSEDNTEEEEEDVSEFTASSSGVLSGAGDFTTPRRRRPYRHDYGSSPEVVKKPEPKKVRKFGENYDYRKFNDYVRGYRESRRTLSCSEPNKHLKLDDFLGQGDCPTTPDDVSTSPSVKVLTTDRRTRSEEAIWRHTMRAIPEKLQKTEMYRRAVEKRGKVVNFLRSLMFPAAITLFLVLTTCSLTMVAINTVKLMFGFRSLPVYAQYIEVTTRHSFGLFGAFIETLIIMYVMCTSFVGLYSLPLLRSLRPTRKDTPMPTIIINSSIILVVSSALPVIVNTLGMTTFDLLGAHSSLQWLGNFRVVVAYNALFLVLSGAFLFNQLTAAMRRRIWRWILDLRCYCRRPAYSAEEDADSTIIIIGGAEFKKDN